MPKIDNCKKGTLILTSLLEDLEIEQVRDKQTPRLGCHISSLRFGAWDPVGGSVVGGGWESKKEAGLALESSWPEFRGFNVPEFVDVPRVCGCSFGVLQGKQDMLDFGEANKHILESQREPIGGFEGAFYI